MGLIYLALYKGRGTLFNRLVRLWTRSKYSHCELVLADGRWLSASAMDGGVRAKHIELNLEHWDLIPLPWADYSQIAHVFRANAGQGYDFFGLFGSQLLPVGLHSRRRWFCSEFCAAALGFPMPQRYSPAQLGEVVQHINTLTLNGQWNEAHA
ncbi:hypothetical protein LNN35_08410 [Pseudomonas stutzeri]|uniref:hypothetical protein n=1 Tax=Stutzerimonas stutzeri TaxID=316 RepID=UPI001E51F4AA|nr:hypothetical protein [Stutzerimonas stutzeri]MCC8342808.1 hypothetical protein [Stutzerimonas stutzeri]